MDGLAGTRRRGAAPRPGPAPSTDARSGMGTRPLKRWRYVGVYTPELMLCVGDARIGGVPQRWWAVALPDGQLRERTTIGRGGVTGGPRSRARPGAGRQIDLELESASPRWRPCPRRAAPTSGPPSSAAVPVRGQRGGRWQRARASMPRPASWTTPPATTRATPSGGGRPAWGDSPTAARWAGTWWTGIHDSPSDSERTVWVDGEPREVGPVEFARRPVGGRRPALHRVVGARGERATCCYCARATASRSAPSRASCPAACELAEGYGVMEEHEAWW